ncbi:uncharacterized protein PHALS_13516 [Plasmopara halstedii]|uniref:Uncharacterized protein n=1 Tax=Plasmopara halstedii TaxID=4781 RepID=A0A0P1APC2_PLAHL|nr:uncharacterized protein PHALS_13516 [Plasmopara halstedii]CEG43313.1 hypothetical protein PHALS_13516 [Plasmopara halstedii]|eukprot:XP_024579682.1 hypothetical protein PHALS_13516 [Plasmopara halstedii]
MIPKILEKKYLSPSSLDTFRYRICAIVNLIVTSRNTWWVHPEARRTLMLMKARLHEKAVKSLLLMNRTPIMSSFNLKSHAHCAICRSTVRDKPSDCVAVVYAENCSCGLCTP